MALSAVHAAAVAITLAPIGYVAAVVLFEGRAFDAAVLGRVSGNLTRWGHLLSNTAAICLVAMVVAMPAGYVLSWLLSRTDLLFRRVIVGLLIAAAAFPLYAMAGTAAALGGMTALRGSVLAVGVMHGAALLPLTTLILWSGFAHTAAAAEEMAQVDGASRRRIAWRISLPQAYGKVAVAGLVVIVWTATDYTLTDLFLVRTFAEEVYTQFALHGRVEEPAIACVPLVLILFMLIFAMRGPLLNRRPEGFFLHGAGSLRLGALRTPATAGGLLISLGLALLPLVSVGWALGRRGGGLQTTAWFIEELSVSLGAALSAAVLVTAFAVGLAWLTARRRYWKTIVAGWVVVSLAVPGPILAIGLIGILNRPGLLGMVYDSPAVLVLVYWIRFLPIATLLLIPFFASVPMATEEAAELEGASTARVLYCVAAPQCWPGILLCGVIVAIASLGELPSSVLVTPPGYVTVTHRFFSLIHYGMYPDAAVLCLMAVGGVGVLSIGVMWLLLRGKGI